MLGQAGEAVERREAARGDRDELLQHPTLGREVPGAGGEPGADCHEILGGQGVGGEAFQGLAGTGDVLGGQRQVEPGTPDDRVVGPPLQALFQELSGRLVSTGPGRQVGLGEPDSVVVGGSLAAFSTTYRSSSRRTGLEVSSLQSCWRVPMGSG